MRYRAFACLCMIKNIDTGIWINVCRNWYPNNRVAHEPRFCISITFEEDDWPPGVLRKDSIPATAASLTIDADGLLRGFDQLHRQVLFLGG